MKTLSTAMRLSGIDKTITDKVIAALQTNSPDVGEDGFIAELVNPNLDILQFWEDSGEHLSLPQIKALIGTLKEATGGTTTVDVKVDLGEKPKSPGLDIFKTFNLGISKRKTDRTHLPKVLFAIRIVMMELMGLRQWLLDNFDERALHEIKDPALQKAIPQWFRQVGVKEASGYVQIAGQSVEILGTNVRAKTTQALLEAFGESNLDFLVGSIGQLARGADAGSTFKLLGTKGGNVSVPNGSDMVYNYNTLLDQLNDMFTSGLHLQNALAMIDEYQLIVYPALMDLGFVGAIRQVRLGNRSPLEALQEVMPKTLKFGLQLAEVGHTILQDLIVLNDKPTVKEFLTLGEAALAFDHATRDYEGASGHTNREAGFAGMGSILQLTIQVGGVKVQVTLGKQQPFVPSEQLQKQNANGAFTMIFEGYLNNREKREVAWNNAFTNADIRGPRDYNVDNNYPSEIFSVCRRYGSSSTPSGVKPTIRIFIEALVASHPNLEPAAEWYLTKFDGQLTNSY